MTQTPTQLLTYEEYRQRPYDGRRTELVEGRVIELNDPTAAHTNIIDNLRDALRTHMKTQRLAYLVKFDAGVQTARSDTGRSPDLVVCGYEQWLAIEKDESKGAAFKLSNPPLIVVEVLSPGTESIDMGSKQWEYEAAGVPEYWRANHRKRWVEVLTLINGKYQVERFSSEQALKSMALPKLELTPAQLFSQPKLPWEED